MAAVIIVLGVFQVLAGIFVELSSKSAIHEILGAIAFGMGVMCVALGLVISRLDELRHSMKTSPSAEVVRP